MEAHAISPDVVDVIPAQVIKVSSSRNVLTVQTPYTLHNVTSQVHNVTAQVESILLKGKKKQHSRSRRDLNNVKKGLSQWLGRKIQR